MQGKGDFYQQILNGHRLCVDKGKCLLLSYDLDIRVNQNEAQLFLLRNWQLDYHEGLNLVGFLLAKRANIGAFIKSKHQVDEKRLVILDVLLAAQHCEFAEGILHGLLLRLLIGDFMADLIYLLVESIN